MAADHGGGRLLHAAGERHRVGPAGDHLQPFAINGLGQHGGGGRAVAGDLVGLRGRLFDELGRQVLLRVVQRDFFGDGHAVLGDLWGAPSLVEDRIAAARAERRHHGPGQLADAGGQRLPSLVLITPSVLPQWSPPVADFVSNGTQWRRLRPGGTNSRDFPVQRINT